MSEPYRREYEYYCPKCGDCHFITYKDNQECVICGYKMLETPHEYNLTTSEFENNTQTFYQNEQRLFDEIISKLLKFDINLYNNRDNILKQREQQYDINQAILESKRPPIIECPYCHSTDTKKISALSKIGDAMLLGFFSPKIYKQWHCDNCGSDF